MPHKRSSKKKQAPAEMLVATSPDNVVRLESFTTDRDNLVTKMSEQEIRETTDTIFARYESARQHTELMAQKMDKWDKQYKGLWQDPAINDEQIFLPKTREQVQVVYSYILMLVSQLKPIVTMEPMVSSIIASKAEYDRAKVKEAMLDFYFDDMWKIRDDVFPRWLKTFIKYSMAVWKVTYNEDSFLPDLRIDVVDRAFLYIDPAARDLKNARWVIEKYFLPRSEVIRRIDAGHWHLDEVFKDTIHSGYDQISSDVLRRYFGDQRGVMDTVKEDEQIECWDYWQAPIDGLQDLYAVMLGGDQGLLVRYGRNPFPYKGLPYRGKSFDQDEYRPDGIGLVEQYTPFQEIVNNFLNMRITDVRKNIIQPVAATSRFITAETQQDFKDGNKIVRLSDEVLEASKDPGFDLRKHFVPLPFQPSTQELLVADLPFVLGQGKEATHVSDVFRGQAPPHQATLGQIQEQLSRNQGVFRPIYLQVMRGFEELAEICNEYFSAPEFFPTDRIIRIIGKNKYQDVIKNWANPGGNVFVRAVSPDEMDVDVTIDAVSAADALASRTFLITSLEQIFQSIGQIPDLFQELRKELDFARIAEIMLTIPGVDVDAIRLSPEMKQQRQQEQAQAQQQAMKQAMQTAGMQAMMEGQIEKAREQARAQGQMAVDTNKVNLETRKDAGQATIEHQQELQRIRTEIREELKADIQRMMKEARLEWSLSKVMPQENTQVGHGNNVNK